MTVTYEVGGSSGGGHLDIDFYVSAARLAETIFCYPSGRTSSRSIET